LIHIISLRVKVVHRSAACMVWYHHWLGWYAAARSSDPGSREKGV